MALVPRGMPQVFYVHWNEHEAGERAAGLAAAGYDVGIHWSDRQPPRLGDNLPDAVVISLDRLPSHGRAVAEWFWEAKKRRHIPVLFEGGRVDKAAVARQEFPDAQFCKTGQVPVALERLLASARKSST